MRKENKKLIEEKNDKDEEETFNKIELINENEKNKEENNEKEEKEEKEENKDSKEKESNISFKKKDDLGILSPMSGSRIGAEGQEDDIENEKSNLFAFNEELENVKNKLEEMDQKLITLEKNSKLDPQKLLGETRNSEDVQLIKLNMKSLEEKIDDNNKKFTERNISK